jgi:hypothetical protein
VIRVGVREGKAENVGEIGGRVSVAGWSQGEAMVAATDGKIWRVTDEGARVELVKREEDGKVQKIDWHALDQVALIVEQDGKILV